MCATAPCCLDLPRLIQPAHWTHLRLVPNHFQLSVLGQFRSRLRHHLVPSQWHCSTSLMFPISWPILSFKTYCMWKDYILIIRRCTFIEMGIQLALWNSSMATISSRITPTLCLREYNQQRLQPRLEPWTVGIRFLVMFPMKLLHTLKSWLRRWKYPMIDMFLEPMSVRLVRSPKLIGLFHAHLANPRV